MSDFEPTGTIGMPVGYMTDVRAANGERVHTDVLVCVHCGALVAADLRDMHLELCPAPAVVVRPNPDETWPARPDTDRGVVWGFPRLGPFPQPADRRDADTSVVML